MFFGVLLGSGIGHLTARRRRTAEPTGLRSWHVGAVLAGVVIVLALVATLASPSWTSAWDPLYGSGDAPGDLSRAESLAREAEAAQAGC